MKDNVFCYAAILLALLTAAPDARAATATDHVRTRIERLYELLAPSTAGGSAQGERQAARSVLDDMFDWTEMARRSLDRHWDERTAAERTEFVRLFSELFQRTYVSRIQLADREKFQYLGEVADGERTVVRTRIVTTSGREIPVDYHTRHAPGGGWKILDLEVGGVSLVNGYRSQFTRLMSRSSYQDLIDKLRAMVEKPTGAAPGAGVVLVGAGDIASCDGDGAEGTAALLDAIAGVVVTLGDHAYEAGTSIEFAACYDPSWGRHKARTRPTPGNHDYLTAGASGYFDYFGAAAGARDKGYYSYRLGGWHVIALNSNCSEVGGCAAGSPQERWLRGDLAANRARCTLAYWHHPRFSSAPRGGEPEVGAFWQALYEADAEIILSAHDHVYERFGPQDPEGRLDTGRGLRQFVVGTGGASHHRLTGPAAANSETRNDATFGVLKLTLYPERYEWEFIPVAGASFTDSGAGRCH